uniref:Chromosome 8 open reading frame 82 n=1 Tax=Anas platyrhynchos platyrhynchos TaxID=8840 RepID=A0A493SYP6_ANAPP
MGGTGANWGETGGTGGSRGGGAGGVWGGAPGGSRAPMGAVALPQLFLDDAKVKNFITCFKDQRFLTFFFERLRPNRSGRYEAAFPYLSPCGRERNYVRCEDRTTTTGTTGSTAAPQLLSYCGGGERLAVPFEPRRLAFLPENGRLYHPAPARAGGVGLVSSALADEWSPAFEYKGGAGRPPTHFTWRGVRYELDHELVPLGA